jgi:hypothetical protein
LIDAFLSARSPEELERALAAARPGASSALARMLDEIAVRNGIVGFLRRATVEGTLLLDMGPRFVERRFDGTRLREWPARGCILVGCDRGMALARATRNAYQAMGMPLEGVEEMVDDQLEEGESYEETLFALELATGRWCAPPPTASWADEEPYTELPRLTRADGATALVLCDRGWARAVPRSLAGVGRGRRRRLPRRRG